MKTDFIYKLEFEGKEYKDTEDPGISFKEQNFFCRIQDAVEAIMIKDIRKFDKLSDTFEPGRYYDTARVISIVDSKMMFEIFKFPFVSFQKTLPPTAGIFLHFGNKTVRDFEQLTGYNFKDQRDYNPQSRYLEIARYYDHPKFGRELVYEFGMINWKNNLQHFEENNRFSNQAWKYKVQLVETQLKYSSSCPFYEILNFHFQHMPDSFQFLLSKADIGRMDREIEQAKGAKNWISAAILCNRDSGIIAEFVTAKKWGENGITSAPGIHLKSHLPIKQLEEDASVDLSGFYNYGMEDNCLLIADYFRNSLMINPTEEDFSRIIPHSGYTSLLSIVNENRNQRSLEKTINESTTHQRKVTGKRTIPPPHLGGPKL